MKKSASRGAGPLFAVLTAALAVAAIVLYRINGITIYCTAYNSKIFICCGLSIAFTLLSLIVDRIPLSCADEFVKPVRAVSFLLLLYAVMQYCLTQAMFLGAVFVAIDVDQYSPLIPGFVLVFSCLALGTVAALLGTCLDRTNRAAKE